MRTYRKRPWAALLVNMTPLIDVVFLIIIFFIIMINFSEAHLRTVNLPKADEAIKSRVENKLKIPITIKSKKLIFWERQQLKLSELTGILEQMAAEPGDITVQIRANEDVAYETIKAVLLKLAGLHINKIEFATTDEAPDPLEKDEGDETQV
jgi:biopolymer transport protein ExbD